MLPQRILMGPGPSDVEPRVLAALGQPTIGHLDPAFLQVMNEIGDGLRGLFQTNNELTLAMSGTGSAGMETALVNLIEPGDKVLVAVNGLFGERMCDIVGRTGGELVRVESAWGRIIEPDQVEQALKQHAGARGIKVVAVVHAETSTGVLNPVHEIAAVAHRHDALCLVDAVTSLGGTTVAVDDWELDAVYSGTQKCLSCPPGLSPVTFGERARRAINERKAKVQSWYLDLTMIQNYWGQERFYHHTAPVNMLYALREALRIIDEEGLEARFARHRLHSDALKAGLTAMGMELFAQEGYQAPMLTTVRIPNGVDDGQVRRFLLAEYDLEIGGGLGPVKGRIWRIGLMGYSARKRNVMTFLAGLEEALRRQGHEVAPGAGIAAAAEIYKGRDAS